MEQNKKLECFVVMGFGTKTDFATGRKIDLDYSYNALIKPVVESKGLRCIRADEIKHSGSIDVPMYQQLLHADVVIADLSTSNANAFYELGVRHALRPHTTIVIAEQQMAYPFDLNHILISKYNHLGLNIDYYEVIRFQKYLAETLDAVLKNVNIDSPVYTFLDNLVPPVLGEMKSFEAAPQAAPKVDEVAEEKQTLSLIVKQGEDALVQRDFVLAKQFFSLAIQIASGNKIDDLFSNDVYLMQRLAYATYKSRIPDEVSSLKEAINLLLQIDLKHSNDPETVVLGGKIEKRLYFNGQGEVHLQYAILNYQRCYYLLNNRYHGINLSFLLNARVASNIYAKQEDKIADMVWAGRIRLEVLKMCEKDALIISERNYGDEENDYSKNQKTIDHKELSWILVNKAEALYGLGRMEEYKSTLIELNKHKAEESVLEVFNPQMKRLRDILLVHGNLLNPAWQE